MQRLRPLRKCRTKYHVNFRSFCPISTLLVLFVPAEYSMYTLVTNKTSRLEIKQKSSEIQKTP